jgi:hypothetical protein
VDDITNGTLAKLALHCPVAGPEEIFGENLGINQKDHPHHYSCWPYVAQPLFSFFGQICEER